MTILASVFFVAAWSSGFLVAKFATSDASPLTLLFWRFLPLALGLGLWVGVRGGFRGITGRDPRRQSAIGLLAQLGYCVFVYASVFHGVASGTTALTDAVQPIVIATLVGPLLGVAVGYDRSFPARRAVTACSDGLPHRSDIAGSSVPDERVRDRHTGGTRHRDDGRARRALRDHPVLHATR
ncbi:DMT family transporter [Curtobacterium sp. TC1]|uniref:DMT family transporter n=1 Tax=Curtobacterium sp. TC1 TaxID=2862880 RepID=UPI001C9B7DDD|nr:DMT family transporter [Curtobacterium sp. TC1]QZQ53842.1 DMT family transporter [Curtobacterium sp. TC1]